MRANSALFCLACPALGAGGCLPAHHGEDQVLHEIVGADVSPSANAARPPPRPEGGRSPQKAATRIQSIYRGHAARQSLSRRLSGGAVHEAPSAVRAGARISCPAGHALAGRHAQRLCRCALCGELVAQGAFVHECGLCEYLACDGCGGESNAKELQAGEQVRLCNMRFPLLNCLTATVVQESSGRRYTVRLPTLNDTLTLPLSSIIPLEDESSADGGNSDGETRARASTETSAAASSRSLSFASGAAAAVRRTLRRHTTRLTRSASLAGPLLEAWWAEKKLRAKEQLLEASAPVRKRVLDCVGEFLRQSALRDPDLWPWLRAAVQSAVVGLWEDIEAEVELGVEAAVHRMRAASAQAPSTGSPQPQSPAAEQRCAGQLLRQLRAGFLHHYLPSDKTIFGKMHDPVYVAMVVFTTLPVFGVRFLFFSCLLAMLLFPGPPDEYQLVSFILHFKGTQFFTSGVLMALVGAMDMFSCYMSRGEDLQRCFSTRGPGTSQLLAGIALDYFGSVALVWVAFAMLPRSKRHPGLAALPRAMTREVRGTYCCCLEGVLTQGGRLLRLLRYDVACFALSASLFLLGYAWCAVSKGLEESVHARLLHAKVAIYWGSCLYALLSLPFVLFVIPVFSRLLTHSVFTGYDRNGVLVEFAFPEAQGSKNV